MGILMEGTPLSWAEIVPHVDRIKELALGQFIAIYNKLKDRDAREQLRWGDEIEYVLVHFDETKKKARVSLRAEELLEELSVWEAMNNIIGYENRTLWRPEFASYMIEGTPGTPYGGLLESFRDVEKNMCLRRAELGRLLHKNEALMSISFPALGVPDFTEPPMQKLDEGGKPWVSDFFSEEMINKCHPRFVHLTRNIIERRGGDRMAANVPIFRDCCTPIPFIVWPPLLFVENPLEKDEFVDPRAQHQLAKPDHIFLDHIGFGTGLCCLQVTMQGSDMDEARWLYDQLAPLTPVMVALSAATPIYRGILANVDARWDVIAKVSDDRTPEERQNEGKTRFGTVDCFIHPSSIQFNDIPVHYEERVMARLLTEGVDPAMAQHIAHLFIWDPLLVYAENLEQNKENGKNEEAEGDDEEGLAHFNSLQSSIWSSLRFKPPPSQRLASRLGWRVEFRPMEVQLTDFENAAFCCFLVLLSRVLLSDRLSLVMPISLIDQNMERAQQKDAVLNQKFHFRTDLENGDRKMLHQMNGNGQMNGQKREMANGGQTTINVRQMTINEIINGDGADFPGLVPLCLRWLDSAGDAPLDVQTRGLILEYLQFVQKRATGKCATLARWMREFVADHPDYKKDSRCPDSTISDLLKEMDKMAKGESRSERLLGNFGQRKWLLEAKAAGKWQIGTNGQLPKEMNGKS